MDRTSKNHHFSLPSISLNSTSTSSTIKKSLPTKHQDKPYYKVVYPLRNRKKYGIRSDCNAAPNAEYIVTGRGYNFRRHNNKFIMNINSDVFFDDKPVPIFQAFPNRGAVRRQVSLPPIQNHKEQKKLSHAELQQKLEENLQVQEKLHHNLIRITVKLEEKKYKQQIQEMKMIEQYDKEIKEIVQKQKQERKEIKEAHLEEIEKLKNQYVAKVDDIKTNAAHNQLLLKQEIAHKEEIIKQDMLKSKFDIVKNLKRKEEELTSLHERTTANRKMEITEKLNQIQLAYIRDVENKYKCIIIDKTTKHQQETEKLFKNYESSARKVEELTKVTKALHDAEIKTEQLEHEKADIIHQQEITKAKTRKVEEELNECKKEFQAKIDKVNERYSKVITKLTNEATELKQMLSRKTDEIIEEERRSRESLFRIRKSMLQARFSTALPSTIDSEVEDEIEKTEDSA